MRFSDGSTVKVGQLPDDAKKGLELRFVPRDITWLEVRITKTKNDHPYTGLGEIAVFACPY